MPHSMPHVMPQAQYPMPQGNLPDPTMGMMPGAMENYPTAMTWEQLEQPQELDRLGNMRSELDMLHEQFFNLVANIYSAQPEEMQGRTKLNFLEQAVQEYTLRIAVAVGLGEPEEKTAQEEAIDMMRKNPSIRNYPYAGYSSRHDLAEFFRGQKFVSRTLAKLKNMAPDTYDAVRKQKRQVVQGIEDKATKHGLIQKELVPSKADPTLYQQRNVLTDKGKKFRNYAVGTGIIGVGGLGAAKVIGDQRAKAEEARRMRNPLYRLKSIFS